jgi:signal transduction histidine kinase
MEKTMKIEIIDVIYLLLIAAGSAMIIVLGYLRYLTNRAFKVIPLLIEKNEACDYDLNKFLPEAQTLLRGISIESFFYDIAYAGNHIEKKNETNESGIKRDHKRADYAIHIGIVPKNPKGERKYIFMIVFQALFLLVEMDILIRIKAINEAFYNFSRLQTFVLHDLKNVTQFIQTMLFNVEKVKGAGREHTFIEYLKESAPSLSLRANRIVGMLQVGAVSSDEENDREEIKVRDLLDGLLKLYQIKGEVTGHAVLYEEEHKIITIFDGIVKNIHEKSLQEPDVACFIYIREEENDITVLIQDTGSHVKNIERIFEPFYTTKKTGLGIGMFQAKHLVESLGGNIKVENTDAGVEFTVALPKRKPDDTAESPIE